MKLFLGINKVYVDKLSLGFESKNFWLIEDILHAAFPAKLDCVCAFLHLFTIAWYTPTQQFQKNFS